MDGVKGSQWEGSVDLTKQEQRQLNSSLRKLERQAGRVSPREWAQERLWVGRPKRRRAS